MLRVWLVSASLIMAYAHADPAGDRRGYTLLKRYRSSSSGKARALLAQTDPAGRDDVLRSALAYAAFHNEVGGVAALLKDQRLTAFAALDKAYFESVRACASPSVARLQVMAESMSPLYAKELRERAEGVVREALTAALDKGRRFVRECEHVNDLVQGEAPESTLKINLGAWYAASREVEAPLLADDGVLAKQRDLVNRARVEEGYLPFNDGWTPGAAR